MSIRFLAAVTLAVSTLTPMAAVMAQSATPVSTLHSQFSTLHSQWAAGQTLRYLIQRDPYFTDPNGAVAAVSPDVPYQPPVVERLIETVQKVGTDGTVTLALTLTPEPGFEDESHPQSTLRRTVTVTPTGRILAISGGLLGNSPAERDLLRGLPTMPVTGQDIVTRTLPPSLTEQRTPNHDGTLLRTTLAAQSDRLVFDRHTGSLIRQDSTVMISSRLVMTGRGRRGVADFGHVVPHTQVIQTLTVERQDDGQ